jgi:hypothetical protein
MKIKLSLAVAVVAWAMCVVTALLCADFYATIHGIAWKPPQTLVDLLQLAITAGLVGLGTPAVLKLHDILHRKS